MLALLILAAIADLGLAGLLLALSGFFFDGPEGANGEPTAVAAWIAMLAACIIAPVVGFVLRSRGRVGLGVLIAWLPPAGALLLATGMLDPLFRH